MSERAGSASVDDTGVVDELIASGARVGELIEVLIDNPNTTIRDQVEELIQSFDVLHREAMVRIAGLLAKQHLLEQAIEDPVLSFIFDLYELTPEQILAAQKREEAVAAGGLIKLGDIRHFKAEPASDATTDGPKGSPAE